MKTSPNRKTIRDFCKGLRRHRTTPDQRRHPPRKRGNGYLGDRLMYNKQKNVYNIRHDLRLSNDSNLHTGITTRHLLGTIVLVYTL